MDQSLEVVGAHTREYALKFVVRQLGVWGRARGALTREYALKFVVRQLGVSGHKSKKKSLDARARRKSLDRRIRPPTWLIRHRTVTTKLLFDQLGGGGVGYLQYYLHDPSY